MRLKLIAALRRRRLARLRRRASIERARLDELRDDAKAQIASQERRVEAAQSKYDDALDLSSQDIAHFVELRGKAQLFA